MSSLSSLIFLLAARGSCAPAAAAAPATPAPAVAKAPTMHATMEDTVAVVNGKPILLSEYQKEAATNMDYWSHTNPAALTDPAAVRKIREGTLEELITRELLVQEGERQKMKVRERELDNAVETIKERFKKDDAGAPVDEETAEKAFGQQLKNEGLDYAKFRERLSHQILANKVITENVRGKLVPPTDDELKAYFDKVLKAKDLVDTKPADNEDDDTAALREAAKQVRALSSERVRARRIVIRLSPGASENERRRALKTLQDIKKRIDEGEDFEKVAKAESEDPATAPNGGDMGYITRGVAPAALEKAAFTLKLGDVSDPILLENGYTIIRVTEQHAAEAPNFDNFKADLANFLNELNFHKKLDAFVKKLHDGATIERHLPTDP